MRRFSKERYVEGEDIPKDSDGGGGGGEKVNLPLL
jgi:hypothetical protein